MKKRIMGMWVEEFLDHYGEDFLWEAMNGWHDLRAEVKHFCFEWCSKPEGGLYDCDKLLTDLHKYYNRYLANLYPED